ncbi:MAG: hypothetical protein IPM74_14800 [Crocinitomicaceae bacterium]|nr:hypothetical protein [Crocinitomicaceae bacterium]
MEISIFNADNTGVPGSTLGADTILPVDFRSYEFLGTNFGFNINTH